MAKERSFYRVFPRIYIIIGLAMASWVLVFSIIWGITTTL